MSDLNINGLNNVNNSMQSINLNGDEPSNKIIGGEPIDSINDVNPPTATLNSYGDYLNKHTQLVWGKDYSGTNNSKSDVLESQAAACVIVAFFDWAFHGFN